MVMQRIDTISPDFTAEYLNDAEVMVHHLHEQAAQSDTTPTLQINSYEVPARHINGAVGRVGLQLYVTQERCPVEERLVPMRSSLAVYDDAMQLSVSYEYNPDKFGDVWMRRLSSLEPRKARPITLSDTIGLVSSRLKRTDELRSVLDMPNPSNADFIYSLESYSQNHKSRDEQTTEYSVPLPTKSVRTKQENDASAKLSIKTADGSLQSLGLDVASFHELEHNNLLRVISIKDAINKNTTNHSVTSLLALFADGRVPRSSIRAEKTDIWQLHKQLKMGYHALTAVLDTRQ